MLCNDLFMISTTLILDNVLVKQQILICGTYNKQFVAIKLALLYYISKPTFLNIFRNSKYGHVPYVNIINIPISEH